MFDLISELRQLAHDLVAVSPQSSAIKAKHPAILDAAAAALADKDEQIRKLTAACEAALLYESSIRCFCGNAEGDEFSAQLRAALTAAREQERGET